jgi:hypothetical protein
VLPVPMRAVEEPLRLLCQRPVIGADVFELPLVGTMNVNGIRRICILQAAYAVSAL